MYVCTSKPTPLDLMEHHRSRPVSTDHINLGQPDIDGFKCGVDDSRLVVSNLWKCGEQIFVMSTTVGPKQRVIVKPLGQKWFDVTQFKEMP